MDIFDENRITWEHSYRGALQRLLSDLMPGLTVLNEPRRIACGAPDYIIARRGGCRQSATI